MAASKRASEPRHSSGRIRRYWASLMEWIAKGNDRSPVCKS